MIIKTTTPKKQYPYLAYWVGSDKTFFNEMLINLKKEYIVLISTIKNNEGDNQLYVQPFFGGAVAFLTSNEEDYEPLPNGYTIHITQEFK
jgi:hypothetical protein